MKEGISAIEEIRTFAMDTAAMDRNTVGKWK